MNEIPHPGFDKPEQYETFTTTNGLEEAADNHIRKVVDTAGHHGWDWTTQDIADAFIAGAEWDRNRILALIRSRLSEIIGDAQPKPALRAELEELIKLIKEVKK
jgi:hypothetical protein